MLTCYQYGFVALPLDHTQIYNIKNRKRQEPILQEFLKVSFRKMKNT